MTVADLATKLGVSAPLLYQVADGTAKQRPLYHYALQGLGRELNRKRIPRHAPELQEPPINRKRIVCPECKQMMYRGNQTKNPDSGVRLWRMFCKGRRQQPHETVFVYVDDDGIEQSPPSKRHRRKLAPFEKRLGVAKCTDCQQDLQWQEVVLNRWGYTKLYCYRCTNRSNSCSLSGKRTYRDANGKVVHRDPGWPLNRRRSRRSDFCPACGGRLWRTGSSHGNKRVELLCKQYVGNRSEHRKNRILYPIIYYYVPGRGDLYVYGTKRLPNGARQFMSLQNWVNQQQRRMTPENFFVTIGTSPFTIRDYADAIGVHEVTAGNKLVELERLKKIIVCADRRGRRKAYRAASED
jgi:hypothetical protein